MAFLALSLAACAKAPAPPSAPPDIYAMRGEIVRLPAAGEREVILRHEAVPGFRDDAGKIVGMDAMTMPFTLSAAALAGAVQNLATGDRVAFTLEVRWSDPHDTIVISGISRLPAGERLAWEARVDATPVSPPSKGATP
ncbi:MAG: copper-binding protein [Thermoanaerobaculia bacterium]